MTINNTYQNATQFSISIGDAGFEAFESRITDFEIPSVSSPAAIQDSRYVEIKHPGSGIVYEPLQVNVVASGGFANAKIIYDWLRDNLNTPVQRDLILSGRSATETVVFRVIFENAFPTNISFDQFTSTDANDTILKFAVTFEYTQYRFE